ncbi:hypothetical protein BC629DRAFT_4013 [Irpex lacteus]|nr:hypothetical protein BC629DRAFT_4013 [Irpex lacteus]
MLGNIVVLDTGASGCVRRCPPWFHVIGIFPPPRTCFIRMTVDYTISTPSALAVQPAPRHNSSFALRLSDCPIICIMNARACMIPGPCNQLTRGLFPVDTEIPASLVFGDVKERGYHFVTETQSCAFAQVLWLLMWYEVVTLGHLCLSHLKKQGSRLPTLVHIFDQSPLRYSVKQVDRLRLLGIGGRSLC